MKRFGLEVIFDCSFFEEIRGRKRFRYRTKSAFVSFRSIPQRLRHNATSHLARFLKENMPYLPVDVRLYEERSAESILTTKI